LFTLEPSHWRNYFKYDKNFKIGICWYGNTVHGPNKFMPLSYFAQLNQLPNVSLYSLQKVGGLDQLEQLEQLSDHTVINTFGETFDEHNGCFMDTAAIMKHLDLVITVDTSMAHLAGGLGVPTWVVLPFPAEWRWLIDRTDSPWYPTIKLFRKKADSNWQEVIDDVKDNVKEVMAKLL